MKTTKRIISFILLLTLLVGLIPTTAQAEEMQTTVESVGTTIEGTNSFGTLLSEKITEEQESAAAEESEHEAGYTVTDLKIAGNTAMVTYDTMEEATLVVAVYTEDGLQLLNSGKATVYPEATEATVTIEGEMPEYFMASAFLLDTYDMSPLCASYDTPMYTQEMQELLASTVEDYDSKKVLNLDDDNTTNFAVYADDTIVIEAREGVNTVASVDDETSTYIIENANESITSLVEGDVFAYPYGENEILIAKVASIKLNGTTATIIGDELEMEEAFSYAKIESEGDTQDIIVDESTGDDGVTYVGMVEDPQSGVESYAATYGLMTATKENEISKEDTLGFNFEKDIGGESVKVKGGLNVKLKITFSYYVSLTRQFLEFKTETETSISISVKGKIDVVSIPLPSLKYMPVPGVDIGFSPKFVVRVSAKVDVSCTVGFTIGASYENGKGITDLSTRPKVELDLDTEGSIFIGIDWSPEVGVALGKVVKLKLEALTGFEVKGEMTGTDFEPVTVIGGTESEESIHTCKACLDCTLAAKMEFSLELKFLNCDALTVKSKITMKEFELGVFYYSFDRNEIGWGSCPNKSYRVTVYVQNAQGQDAFGIDVIADLAKKATEIPMGITNINGVVVDYLQAGTYAFKATVDGQDLKKEVKVEEACKITLDKDSVDGASIFNPESMADNGVVASGECGAEGNNITWILYGSGLLDIQGSGNMASYSSSNSAPWYKYKDYVACVSISDGITSIGNRAFYDCVNMFEIAIPDSITTIGSYAFYNCNSMTSVSIPNGVVSIEKYTFYKCLGLTEVVLSDSLKSIDDHGFHGCSGLTSITIPEKITFIGYAAFADCDNLTNVYITDLVSWCEIEFEDRSSNPLSNGGDLYINGSLAKEIEIPANVASICDMAFYGCTSITKVNISEGVTSIGAVAFESCDNLVSVSIPNSVVEIGGYAFCGSGLTSLVIPDGVTEVPDLLCQWCDNLTRVIVGKGVTSIGTTAFAYCSDLEEIIFTGDAPSTIGYGAFLMTSAIRYYPAGNETWEEFLLENTSDKWQPYTSLDSLMTAQVDDQLTGSEEDLQEQNMEAVVDASENLAGVPSLTSIYDGEYSTQMSDSYILKTASFSGLVPGEEYVLLALVSIQAEDILGPDNLLYIDQKVAAEDGTLVFTYVQREVTDTSYVMACGASYNDLSEAVITFPVMTAAEEIQAVHPTVVFNGETLTEGVDYVVVGTVDYTSAGQYTCYVRGIYNYFGLVQCQYSVYDMLPGDIDGDGEISDWDAIILNRYLAGWNVEVDLNAADVDGDGEVSDWDAIILERYLAGWDVKLES